MDVRGELTTITTTLEELSQRISTLVEESADEVPSDVLSELIAAERAVGTLLRRLSRAAHRPR